MSEIVVRAPATTANLGPGFDCAAAALDLWNELRVEDGDGEPQVTVEGEGADEVPQTVEHLALRAFALVAPVEGYRFRFVNRIPLERGLGSSAATIAAGLVAGAAAAGRTLSPDELLELGLPLEGHADNLAAALRGGVCLIWQNGAGPHTARIAVDLPLAAIVVVPNERVNTLESRSRLPATLTHGEAAAAAAAQAALLGAAIAAGDAALLADAFHDRLHEPLPRGRRAAARRSCARTRSRAPPASRSPAPARRSSSGPRRTRSPRPSPSSRPACPTPASCPSRSPSTGRRPE